MLRPVSASPSQPRFVLRHNPTGATRVEPVARVATVQPVAGGEGRSEEETVQTACIAVAALVGVLMVLVGIVGGAL